LRQGGALRAQGRKPYRHRRERETELEDAIGGAKDGHGRIRDLRPDAVAFHHDDSNRSRRMVRGRARCHRFSSLAGGGA